MAGKKSEIGATGETVRANVARLREERNLSYAEMSRRLKEAGARIPELGLRNLESGKRKVDVDELVALAQVLGVSPVTLLMPETENGEDPAVATGFDEVSARALWRWLRDGADPNPPINRDGAPTINLDAVLRSTPSWVYRPGSVEEFDAIENLFRLTSRMKTRELLMERAMDHGDD